MRALYEDSGVPVTGIARLAGVSARTIYYYARQYGWTPRAARLVAQRCARAGRLTQEGAAAVAAAQVRAARLRAERSAQAEARTSERLAGALVALAPLRLSRSVEFGGRPGSTAATRANAQRAAHLAERLSAAILKRMEASARGRER